MVRLIFSYNYKLGKRNDLWKFNGVNWTWIAGTSSVNNGGNYGTLGFPSPDNLPPARYHHAAWIDASGTVYIFGGVNPSKNMPL